MGVMSYHTTVCPQVDHLENTTDANQLYTVDHHTPSIEKAIVMAKMPYENTSWLSRLPS